MDRLSSCYFCGDALDASLDEYPVVPSELGPSADVQRTVVLCRGCRRKLDSVLDTVLDAAGSGPGGERGSEPAEDALESSLDGGEDLLESVGDDATGGDDGESTVSHGPDGEDSAGRDTGDGATGDAGGGGSDESATGSDPLDGTAGGTEPPAETAPDGDNSPGGETPSGGNPSTERPSGEATGSPDGATSDDGSTGDGVESEPSLTRLEYNRVMRLLQNREFPVRREGFVNVAANAYEISHRECEKILDVAIDHGLIEERDGQLVRPED